MAGGMVIIGGGECGVRAALALREHDHHVPITLVGAEKYLPYERPPLSKEGLADDTAEGPRTIATAERLAGASIIMACGKAARTIGRQAHTVGFDDGTTIPYDRLLIATGAEPRPLALAGPATGRVGYFRTYDDALRLRPFLAPGRHIAIIGGGFIGLEIAAGARKRGAAVTVIEALPRVLSRVVPGEIAEVIEARHLAEGVALYCSARVEGIEQRADAVAVTLGDGRRVLADFLLIGIGAVPVVGLAAAAGLTVDNGVVVDETLRTSDPEIFAAGDCCSFPLPVYGGRRVRLECWRNALDQGALAARNMLGGTEPISALPWFWSDQYDLTLQIAGLPDQGSTTVRRDTGGGSFILFHLDGAGNLVAASGIGHGNAVAKDIRVAEMLIQKGVRPDARQLAEPSTRLKSLLAA